MKRFLLFGGFTYYPVGGMHDLKGDFDLLSEAILAANEGEPMVAKSGYDWWHVLDTDGMEIAASNEHEPPKGFGVREVRRIFDIPPHMLPDDSIPGRES